ncbi:bis(5'-nucleosyl)-tetraphosphatase [asymmetrical]-like [Saccoglossus kowalevskii]|uniref:Bis(5'-nucleosyl)-tetraphosphatase [asymmetrical] n=1 Tax=Saccoglossus kowalevskii TaxID=10224 RepID=A0ABM0GS81_SACKO|nr:PREDICTED: bis(5'-nucleosyl)-tetraphosphatase [asymmetrical]-like [Saccoglossus kowalevskii]
MAATVRAAGLIIFRRFQGKPEYLLMQTSYGQHHWTPPKGHVDPGESDKVTALRETEEEAGLTAAHFKMIEDFKKVLKYNVKGRLKTVVYWLAELVDRNVAVKLSKEHQRYEWLEIDKACDIAKYVEMQEALRDADNFIKCNL